MYEMALVHSSRKKTSMQRTHHQDQSLLGIRRSMIESLGDDHNMFCRSISSSQSTRRCVSHWETWPEEFSNSSRTWITTTSVRQTLDQRAHSRLSRICLVPLLDIPVGNIRHNVRNEHEVQPSPRNLINQTTSQSPILK